jgi:magnesium-protoporphyrin IX monomethyl ester (oxidative) cyclase
MRILLVEPSHENFGKGIYLSPLYSEPLPLEYIASYYSQKEGYEPEIIQQRDDPYDNLLKEILQKKPNLVAFSLMTFAAPNTQKLCKDIKKQDEGILTVVGGYHASGYTQIIEDKNIDFAVIGEGEQTFLQLVRTIRNNEDISKVKGIAYWDKELKVTESRERIQNLDILPWPLRNKKTMSKYKGRAQVTYSRGCPNACPYCVSHKIWGRQVKWRSASDVADEIKMLEDKYNIENIFFNDLNFNINKRKVSKLCNALKERKINAKWQIQGNTDIDRELLELMKESGCSKINFGVEAVSSDTIEIIGRKIDLDKIRKTYKMCDQIGMISRAYFMIGFPHETERHFQELLASLKYMLPDFPRLSIFTPFPGTFLYDLYKKRGLLLTEDFSKYTTDESVVKSNLSPKQSSLLRQDLLEKFYSYEKYKMKIRKKIEKFPHLEKEFEYYLKQKLY